MKKLPIFIFLLLSSFFVSPKVVSAAVVFQDNFDDGIADGWTALSGAGYWHFYSGMYGATINSPQTVANTVADSTDYENYIYEVDMIALDGEDKNLIFRTIDLDNRYGFHISYGSMKLEKRTHGWERDVTSAPITFKHGQIYRIKVVLNGRIIEIYQDGSLILRYEDNEPDAITHGKAGLRVGAGAVYPSQVYYDNVLVTSLEPSPTPTPSLQPLILLPGLGASWNHEKIFTGVDQPQEKWYKTPFMTDYDGLLQTLQNSGYQLNSNLFVFYYDWLKPIDQSANDLKSFIESKVNPPPGTKIDLVGHSLGGLVARTYIQRNSGTHQVDQLITLGSPHKGAPQVYKAWEGVDLNSLLGDKERIGAGILLRLRGFSYPNLVQAIQNLTPSLGNLLFIDDYLKWNNTGTVKPESSMLKQNNWLKNLGTSSELLDLTNTILGTAGDTPRWLKIVERSELDKILGRWEDGKPIEQEFAIGDKTVLEESAKLTGANIITLSGLDHVDLVKSTTGQEKILELLGISGVEGTEQPEIPFEPALVFTVASPATLRVTDPSGRRVGAGIDPPEIPNATFSAQEKIIIIPEALDGEYKIEVISENNGGPYRLLIGQLTQKQDIWSTYQDTVGSGKTNTYTIPIDNALATTDSYLANLINLKLKNLLREILRQEINPLVKTRSTAKILKILGQTEPLPMLLKLERHKLADRYTQRAILNTTTAIDYSEKFNQDLLPPLREILDLLGELHQLLEG